MTNASKLRKQRGRQPGQCTWCGGSVPSGRRTWCSQRCVDAFRMLNDWPFMRRKVWERDRGVCRLCGADCEQIQHLCRMVRSREGHETYLHLVARYREHGWSDAMLWRDLWEADHIKPRVLGGGNELENLRTLCIPCHKRETARLATLRAKTR